MTSSLSGQMLVAYDKSRSRIGQIQKMHRYGAAFSDIDAFELQVRKRFLLGVHAVFSQDILDSLGPHLGGQQQIAAALGLKDRTSISQMRRSGTMDGVRLTAALHQFRHIITLPTRERASLHGFARATSYIKAQVHRDDSIEGTLSAQEFSNLVGVLASDEWDAAIRDSEPTRARAVAVRIVEERQIVMNARGEAAKRRPEQCVLMLTELQDCWGDCAALALCSIPDCIPIDDSGTETTL